MLLCIKAINDSVQRTTIDMIAWQAVDPSGQESWVLTAEAGVYSVARPGTRFSLRHAPTGTQLHCQLRQLPRLQLDSPSFSSVVRGTWRWEGDRESPV